MYRSGVEHSVIFIQLKFSKTLYILRFLKLILFKGMKHNASTLCGFTLQQLNRKQSRTFNSVSLLRNIHLLVLECNHKVKLEVAIVTCSSFLCENLICISLGSCLSPAMTGFSVKYLECLIKQYCTCVSPQGSLK